MSGDKLIKPRSLSGNRLRHHTITGLQINLRKLGPVPRATYANRAGAANSAVSATNATNATNAVDAANANTVGGQPPTAFEAASHFVRSGLVKANAGQTVAVASFGPFTLSLTCNDDGAGNVDAELDATSTEANSDGYGIAMTNAGQPYQIIGTSIGTSFAENDDNAADFFTPSGKTYIADLTAGRRYLGAACFANALVSQS
jgi:hypothetical protein